MDATTIALLAQTAQALVNIVAALNSQATTPVVEAPKASAKPTGTRTGTQATVVPVVPVQASRVEAVAQRERDQIAEARRIERLVRAGHLTPEQGYELAWHQIGKKRARVLMGL